MKKIKLTQDKYALVDDEDYEELNQYKWQYDPANYAKRSYKRKTIRMHRAIMNCPKHLQIDHINGNGVDNRKHNLRICTQGQNNCNTKLSKHNTSGIKGVFWHKQAKKWRAMVRVNRKLIYLGYFACINDAKNAYTKAAKEHFGEFYSDGIRN
jgi:hypothetical protein